MNGTQFDRRQVIVGIGAALMMSGANDAAAEGHDIDSLLAPLMRDGKISGLHTLLAARGDRLLIERYWEGEDWNRDIPLGQVAFGPKVLHDLRSVSKSIVGMLYGIALADGKVPPPEAKLYAQFPEYADLAMEAGRDRLTIAHVLSMTLGTEWDEITFPYSDPRNSEIQMDAAPDRYRFILDRPMVSDPGVKWTYCGGATALLGRLIAKGTGQPLHDFARKAMFEPLGCGDRAQDIRVSRRRSPSGRWHIVLTPPEGEPIAEMSLGAARMLARQLLTEISDSGTETRLLGYWREIQIADPTT